jgi:hypothetical protein
VRLVGYLKRSLKRKHSILQAGSIIIIIIIMSVCPSVRPSIHPDGVSRKHSNGRLFIPSYATSHTGKYTFSCSLPSEI